MNGLIFFNDMVKLQGIGESKITFIEYTGDHQITEEMENDLLSAIEVYFSTCLVSVINSSETAVFVKNFNFTTDLLYVDEFAPELPLELCNGTILINPNEEGISAQGENHNDPQSVFFDHAIVEYNSKYYDPSYGTSPKSSKLTMKTKLLPVLEVCPF